MSDTVIKLENISKQYRLGVVGTNTLVEDFSRWWAKLRGKEDPTLKIGSTNILNSVDGEFVWALKDINLKVKQGEILGIIGKNGAGKSTLLKLLSRVTGPTTGQIKIKGRIASLLEVGTGFHPELTGRENIYLNGAILGMSKIEINNKFDEIVDFSGVEKYIDTPVKRYSSGMYVRLAFAVAAHLESEILLIDEVLSVGDVEFQKKCLGKMGDVAKEGRTVLFVSHNMAAVRKLCTEAMLLDKGRVTASGKTGNILRKYIEGDTTKQCTYRIPPPIDHNPSAWAHTLTIEDGKAHPTTVIPVGRPWQIRVHFRIVQRTEHFIIALGLRTNEEVSVRVSFSNPCILEPGEYQAVFREDVVILASGRYSINIGLSTYERPLHHVENAGFLEIADFTEGIELIRNSGAGNIMNPMNIQIAKAGKSNL